MGLDLTYSIPSGWKQTKLEDIGKIVGGGTPSTKIKEYYEDGEIPWITPKDLSGYNKKYISHGERNITELGLEKSSAKLYPKGTVLFSSRAPIGYVAIASNEVATNQGFKSIIPNYKLTTSDFVYYLLKYNIDKIKNVGSGSTFSEVSGKVMKNIEILLPPYEEQVGIANVLSSFYDKIENNNAIIANLEEQARAIFKSWFVDFEPFQDEEFINSELGIIPGSWAVEEANKWFTINIGKTPPRKQTQWFSTNSKDVKWLSISDMKNTQTFVNKTSEYLTNEAIDKFNVKVVPENSVLVSFKLTIGRVAITRGELTTNEAIAHFHINQYSELYYLYLYLKTFNYQKLGNTSSIGNAVNSKIIKAMPILKPEEEVLRKFHTIINPLFDMIYEKVKENEQLEQIRDALLPKLMSGEIRVEEAIGVE